MRNLLSSHEAAMAAISHAAIRFSFTLKKQAQWGKISTAHANTVTVTFKFATKQNMSTEN